VRACVAAVGGRERRYRRREEAPAVFCRLQNVYCAAVLAANTPMRGVEVKHVRRKDVDLEKGVGIRQRHG
jgi:hypothetical protein